MSAPKLSLVTTILALLLVLVSLTACEIFYHKQYEVPAKGIVVASGSSDAVCSVLEKVAANFELAPNSPTSAEVLCFYRDDVNGFPLLVGARKHEGAILVDVWAWNRGKEHRALWEAVLLNLRAAYPASLKIIDDPYPI